MTLRRTAWLFLPVAAAAMPLSVLAVRAVAVDAAAASQPAAPAASPAASPKAIDAAIEDLGSEDFKVREKAVRTLWEIGEAARPALQQAVQSDNPEIARRAKGVLASFAYGVRPDTPQAVLDLLNLYRQGEPEQRKSVAGELSRQGVPGVRVLLKLSEDEKDAVVRQVVLTAMGSSARPVVAQLIVDQEMVTAERILAALAPHADYAARDYAAFLLLHDGMDRQIAELQKAAVGKPAGEAQSRQLACIYRAQGQYEKAAEAALAANDLMLHGAMMTDAGKYRELAKFLEQRGVPDDSVEELGFVTAFARLSGDQAATDRWAAKLVDYANQNPSDHFNAVEALLLNERTDQAIEVLIAKQNHYAAADYLASRLDFRRLEQVVNRARDQGAVEMPKILCRYAQLLHFQGKSKEADDTLQAVARGEHGQVDFATWMEIVSAAPGAGIERDAIEGWIAQALVVARPQDDLSRVFDRAGFADGDRAVSWWRVLRDHRAGYTPGDALTLVRRIDRKQVAAEEMLALLTKTRELAQTLPGGERNVRLRLLSDTYAEMGRMDEAVEISRQIAERSSAAGNHVHLGELLAKAGKWDAARASFAQAHDAEPSWANAVALQAWALSKLGRHEEAKVLIDRAHLMPLANESARHSLADVFSRHDMKAEARRERELTARLGDPTSWEVCDSIRRLADDVAATDAAAAAALWDRAFLANLTTRTMFVDASANLTIPVLIRRTKAIGKIARGDVAGAMADAEACFSMMPAEADAQIAIIRELDKVGKKAEADQVYKRAYDFFTAIQKQYPESAPANNLLAWLCGSVKRDLDDALACARKGVELEPENTAILDTLSEVHFARGELDQALAINEKCRTLEPHVKHHRDNYERFSKAKSDAKAGASN